MNLAIIPARGGSTRIPRKNIKPFCGKPMLAWVIEAAEASDCFDQVLVSTDDEEIAQVAREHGAITPFVRPEELADHWTGTTPVVRHAVQWMLEAGHPLKNVCCIYATAPFVEPQDIRKGLEILETTQFSHAFGVTTFAFPIQRAIKRVADGGCIPMFPEFINQRSQDLEEAYHDAGQFYWAQASTWLTGSSIFSPESRIIPIPRHRVQDIDTPEDWERAEYLFKAMALEKNDRRL